MSQAPARDHDNDVGFEEAMYDGISDPRIEAFEESPYGGFLVCVLIGTDDRPRLVSGYHGLGGYVRYSCTATMEQITLDVAEFDCGGPTLGLTVTPRLEGGQWVLDCLWDPPPPDGWSSIQEPAPMLPDRDEALSAELPEGYRLVDTREFMDGHVAIGLAASSAADPVIVSSLKGEGGWTIATPRVTGSTSVMVLSTEGSGTVHASARRTDAGWALECRWEPSA